MPAVGNRAWLVVAENPDYPADSEPCGRSNKQCGRRLEAQRSYVQTERLAGTGIVQEVLAFSPASELLTATRMPENDYAIWTAKLVDVRGDGTIVQFLPEQSQAKLNLFTN
jgi:hypothetical protein